MPEDSRSEPPEEVDDAGPRWTSRFLGRAQARSRGVTVMERTDLRPVIADGRTWTIRKCQAGYVIVSVSDDYRRTVDDEGLVRSLDDAKDRVEDLVGSCLHWSHSTLSDTWVAVETPSALPSGGWS